MGIKVLTTSCLVKRLKRDVEGLFRRLIAFEEEKER
jgi:hypothetical protein